MNIRQIKQNPAETDWDSVMRNYVVLVTLGGTSRDIRSVGRRHQQLIDALWRAEAVRLREVAFECVAEVIRTEDEAPDDAFGMMEVVLAQANSRDQRRRIGRWAAAVEEKLDHAWVALVRETKAQGQ